MIRQEFFNRYFHVIFTGAFFLFTCYLSLFSPLWADENVYLELARLVLLDPLKPINAMLSWVPHPPLGWYLFAAFNLMPRLASISSSAVCTFFMYCVSKRLYDDETAKAATVSLLSTLGYMLYSSVAHLDGPLTAFMTLSMLSFLAWIKLRGYKYLLLSGLSLGLSSMTKYTSVPILFGTYVLWLIAVRKKISLRVFLKVFAVLAISLVPLALWAYELFISQGNFARNYSEIYGLFPSDIYLVAVNLIIYTVNLLLIWGLPFLVWMRKRLFDFDVKLLLIYLAVLFVFFILVTPLKAIVYQHQNRYLLPAVPATSIISARSLIEEKPIRRFIILSLQFIGATLFAFLLLLYPPFVLFSSSFYSQLLKMLGISGQ